MQFLLRVKFKICFSFPLLLSTESIQIFLISSQGCAQGLLDELSKTECDSASPVLLSGGEGIVHCSLLLPTVGRPCEGHCNILVSIRTVHFLFNLEAEKPHKALRLLQLGNLAAYHQYRELNFKSNAAKGVRG